MKKVKKTKKYTPKKKKQATKVTKKKKIVKKKTAKKSYYKPKSKIKPVPEVVVENIIPAIVPFSTAEKDQTPKRPVKYLNNRDLLAQVVLSKKSPIKKMTNELAKMLQLLTSRYAKKGNFANYTYNDDMQSYAMLMLVKTWDSFDPMKSSNPFAFFTQCIKNSFIQYLNYEKRQRDIRDEKLVDLGLSPSYGYQYDHEQQQREADIADQEVVEAPTKLVEDIHSRDTTVTEEEPIIPDTY